MTEREAIKWIKAVRTTDARNNITVGMLQRKEAFNMAIKSLEKQIQKKPKFIEDDYVSKSYHFECPVCGEEVERGDNHCDNCLQIMDWSVEE